LLALALLLLLSPWFIWRLRLKSNLRESIEAVRAIGIPLDEAERTVWFDQFPSGVETDLFREAGNKYVPLSIAVVERLPTFRARHSEDYLYARPYPEERLTAMRDALRENAPALDLLRTAPSLPPDSVAPGLEVSDELVELYCMDACLRAVEGDGAGAAESILGGLRYLDCTDPPYGAAPLWPYDPLTRLLNALFSAASQVQLPDASLERIASLLDYSDWAEQSQYRSVDNISQWYTLRGSYGIDRSIQIHNVLFGIIDRQETFQLQSWLAAQHLAGKSWAEQDAILETLRDKPWKRWVRHWSPPQHLELARLAIDVLRYHQETGSLPETLDALVPGFRDTIPVEFSKGQSFVYTSDGTSFQVSMPAPEEEHSRRGNRDALAFSAAPPS